LEILHTEKVDQLSTIKAFIFDWDGVFHNGNKNSSGEGLFSEIDSMGVNMLRFGYFLKNQNQQIPKVYIITGEVNATAKYLSERENFDGVFTKFKDKKVVLDYLESSQGLRREDVLFIFDDILDVSLAERCGVRFLVKHEATALFREFVKERGVVDFITSCSGGSHAVREVAEYILSSINMLTLAYEERIKFEDKYQTYIDARKQIETSFFEMTPEFTIVKTN
jgi:3-deoxy-D-manno-octulosonate 8-phosphate phosphatase (KDO 8-P phosphatase)